MGSKREATTSLVRYGAVLVVVATCIGCGSSSDDRIAELESQIAALSSSSTTSTTSTSTTTLPPLDLRSDWEERFKRFNCDRDAGLGYEVDLDISGEVDFVTLRTAVKRKYSLGDPQCLWSREYYLKAALTDLGFSPSVMERITMTRPIDGTQVAEADEYVATWTADGEGGFTLVVERLP